MRFRFVRHASWKIVLPGIALLSFTTASLAEEMGPVGQRYAPCPPSPCPPPIWQTPSTGAMPSPGTATPTTPGQTTPSATPSTDTTSQDFSAERSVALGGSSVARSAVGYIDDAIPMSQFRLRFDSAYRDNRPDRAEFFYAKCGCFPGAPGPPLAETKVDYQDLRSYLEYAVNNRFSAFIEVPVRFLNPEVNDNTSGLGDIECGFKAALIACQDQFLTFQMKVYTPTGDADRGLGTNHVSLEPALLLYQHLTDRLYFEAELRDWIPIGGTDFAGNIIRYGFGFSYNVYQRGNYTLAPVAELVGWTVLGGKEFSPDTGIQDAAGDTIVNVKLGARLFFSGNSSVYVGYGRALTGDVWYKDIIRAELRLAF